MNHLSLESIFHSLLLLRPSITLGKQYLSPALGCADILGLPSGRSFFLSSTPSPYWALSLTGNLESPHLVDRSSYGGSWGWFYWSEALLISFPRDNLEFLEFLGQWGKMDSEENRYEVWGSLPFPAPSAEFWGEEKGPDAISLSTGMLKAFQPPGLSEQLEGKEARREHGR